MRRLLVLTCLLAAPLGAQTTKTKVDSAKMFITTTTIVARDTVVVHDTITKRDTAVVIRRDTIVTHDTVATRDTVVTHDTVTVVRRDTIVVHDTIVVTTPVGGEPTYDPAQQSLILRDNFDKYSTIGAALNAYPANRGAENMELITGRGGSGHAARLKYGIGAADDIVFGPETRFDRVGGWNDTLPKKAGPYTHFFFTTWFRTSAGANPTENDPSGIKGFMFLHTGNQRYQNAVNQLMEGSAPRGPKGANPDNATSGFNLYKTPDGRAPLWSQYADGQWHRFTIEIYAGNDPSGHFGERYWVDGVLTYSDLDLRVGPGTMADHYNYQFPVTHWMVFGNFVNGSARSSFFTFDVDDWMAWTQ